MASQTEIANRALIHVGDYTITDIDDPDDGAARVIKAAWATARDGLLVDHPWNFARRRALLAAAATAPAFGWAAAYTLPADPWCLRVLAVGADADGNGGGYSEHPGTGWGSDSEAFVVEGRSILTNAGAPLPVTFIARITDPELFAPAFVEALAAKLAHATGPQLGAAATRVEAAGALYATLLREARSIDGQEGTPQAFFRDTFLGARL